VLKQHLKRIIIGFICGAFSAPMIAQNFELIITTKDSSNYAVIATVLYNKVHLSKKSVAAEIDTVANELAKKGYIHNTFEVTVTDSIYNCTFILNEKIEFIRVYYPGDLLDRAFLNPITLKTTDSYFEIPFSNVEYTLTAIVTYFEELGHSFTNAYLTNLSEQQNLLTATLQIDVSPKRTINNVVVKGYPDFPKKYLKHYLHIKPTTTFNKSSLSNLNDLINTIPFVTQIKQPEVLFTKDSTTLYIYVKKKSNSNFDGIIGFSNEESGKLRFNGFIDLNLNNVFNKGESFHINWENSQQNNSTLNLSFNAPYIVNSKFNLNGAFEIFRQDSIFLNTNLMLSVGYTLNQHSNIYLTGTNEKSDVTATPSNTYTIESYKKNVLGASYTYKILESPNYINRYKFIVDGGYFIGNRKSDQENTQQNSFQFLIEYMVHFNFRNSLFLKSTTKILNTANPFENELYRIGGINSIRGFNEKSIITQKFNVTNIEYHYLLNPASYIYTISDIAILNNINTNTTQQLYGVGLGYYLHTNSIILDLSYAVGKNYEAPFDLNNSKFHIKVIYPF
jgi:outer membrane protein assembly factor BamA